MSLYLNQNMLSFYNDVNDIANTYDTYSELDGHFSGIEYQYANSN